MAVHEVRSLAEAREIASLYRNFPEPFLQFYHVQLRIRAVDSVANTPRIYNLVAPRVEHYGWECTNLERLAIVADIANGLRFIADDLVVFAHANPGDPRIMRALMSAAKTIEELGAAVGARTRTLQSRTNTLSHRISFTVRNGGAWDAQRVRNRLEAHLGDVEGILGLQVTFP